MGRFYKIFEFSRLCSSKQKTVLHACIFHSNRRCQTTAFYILSLNLHKILCIIAVLFKLHMLCCIMLHMTHCDVTKWHCQTLCVDKINGTYIMYSDCFQTRWTGSHNNAYLIFLKSSSKVRALIISQQLIRHCLNECYCQKF